VAAVGTSGWQEDEFYHLPSIHFPGIVDNITTIEILVMIKRK
jgi:hypothetical protein